MIEQAMFFALGVCVAGLFALLCIPAISRRATRLARIDVERQLPISVDEIAAARDLLRAEFAAERRRLEQKIERAESVRATDAIEEGRQSAELARLTLAVAELTSARDALALARQSAEQERDDARATIGDLQQTATKAQAALAASEERAERLEQDGMQARLELSMARAREEALAARLDGVPTGSSNASNLSDQIERLDRISSGSDEAAALRRAIVAIGHEVVRLAADSDTSASSERRERRSAG